MSKQEEKVCANCGYTSTEPFEDDICPQCGQTLVEGMRSDLGNYLR